jgi:hypothetical protein
MYRRARWCSNVARRPHVMMMARLKNQSELTQTVYLGGGNTGKLDEIEGMVGVSSVGVGKELGGPGYIATNAATAAENRLV